MAEPSGTKTPKRVIAELAGAWEEPVTDFASRAALAPCVRVHDLLVERGYDDALHRARKASPLDPFALHLGLGHLARALLFGSKVGRPKILADVLLGFLPPRAKPPRPLADLVRIARSRQRDAYPAMAEALASPEFARTFDELAFRRPLAGKPSERVACAERLSVLARQEMTMWFYPFLSRPELVVALVDAASGSALDSPVRYAVVDALGALRRYVVDVRSRRLVVESLASPRPELRAASASALLRAADAAAWPKERWAPVLALLDDDVSAVRERVSFALVANRDCLGERDRRAVAERLEVHLADRALGVRACVVSGLVTLRGAAFLKQARALEKNEKNATMRRVLKRAIAELQSG